MPGDAYVIVLGNEKGGSGKTTMAMHLVVGLMRAGFRVASLDLDARQQSLTRYLENRRRWIDEQDHPLCLPDHHTVVGSTLDSAREAGSEDRQRLDEAMAPLWAANDFVVIDCPGSDVSMSRFAHRLADTLITPLNDSLLDLDVVVRLRRDDLAFLGPGVYAQMVIAQKRVRLKEKRRGTDWILLRNRLSPLESINKRNLNAVLERLSGVLGCRIAYGIGERVIFRQLFLSGLTVLDLRDTDMNFKLSLSHVAARQEMHQLLKTLWLPFLSDRLDRLDRV